MKNCLFCKIANREIPADIIYQDDRFIVFKDINPKAPVHYLIIPKKHIKSVNHLKSEDRELAGELLLIAKKIAREKDISGYRLVFNVGKKGGQVIQHLHLHFLAGEPVQLP